MAALSRLKTAIKQHFLLPDLGKKLVLHFDEMTFNGRLLTPAANLFGRFSILDCCLENVARM